MDKRNTIETSEIDTAEVPEFVYEPLARSLLPVIQKYYESDEGKRAFSEWKQKKNAERSNTTERQREDCHARQSSRFFIYQSSISSI